MGAATSHEFRQQVVKLIEDDVPMSDVDFWKGIFLTGLTTEEIGMHFSALDVRKLRRSRPHNLAVLLYYCIDQLRGFIAAKNSYMDPCSASNAVRILATALPHVFEEKVMPDDDKGSFPLSPFAQDFWKHLFLDNKMCVGDDVANCKRFSKEKDVPLAQTLMRLITESCFVPGFSIGSRQQSTIPLQREARKQYRAAEAQQSQPRGADGQPIEQLEMEEGADGGGEGRFEEFGGAQAAMHTVDTGSSADDDAPPVIVDAGFLWYTGVMTDYYVTSIGFNFSIQQNRIDIMRLILAALSLPVFSGSQKRANNPFLRYFVDPLVCPLGATLCVCFVNCAITHTSKGTLPYTSHLNATGKEAILGLSLDVLSIVLDEEDTVDAPFPPLSPAYAAEGGKDAAQQQAQARYLSNQYWATLRTIAGTKHYVNSIVEALRRIVENPHYASQRKLKGSQRVVGCFIEGVYVLWKLSRIPEIHSAVAERMYKFIMPLLFFVLLAKDDVTYFGVTQFCVNILLSMSATSATFRGMLNKQIPDSNKPIPLPMLPKVLNATYADVLVLVICASVSPSSPVWLHAYFELFATLLANIAPHVDTLHDIVCFEMYHLLDFVSQVSFLRKQTHADPAAIAAPAADAAAVGPESVAADEKSQRPRDEEAEEAPAKPKEGELPPKPKMDPEVAKRRREALYRAHESVCALVVESVQTMLHHHGAGCATLATSLACSDVIPRLRKYMPQDGATSTTSKTSGFTFTNAEQLDAMDFATLDRLMESVKKKMASASPGTTGEQMAQILEEGYNTGALQVGRRPIALRKVGCSKETIMWAGSYMWGIVHKHNVVPPLFDARQAQLFSFV